MISYPVISFSGPIQVDPSAAIGSAIATGQTQTTITSLTPAYKTTTSFFWTLAAVSGVTYAGSGGSVHPTNLNGVGIAVWTDEDNSNLIVTKKAMATATTTHTVYYALVKTANVTSSGTVNSQVFRSIMLACDPSATGYSTTSYSIGVSVTGNPSISMKACTVNNNSINVPLGTAKRTSFTGVGSTANTQSFNISLTCSQATKANITLSPGSSGAFNATSGVINLDPSTTGVAAKGVGIQMLYNNATLPLNSAISVGSVAAAGSLTIPLSARYYQTASTITAGVANGTATFTLTYN